MALREELERSGNRLFRWRSYFPLLLIALFVEAAIEAARGGGGPVDVRWGLVCLATGLLGLLVRVLTVGHAAKGTSGRNTSRQIAATVNTTGLYASVRHPLYVGNFLVGLGWALFPGLWWPVVVYVLAFWLYYERIMYAEEAFLRENFGDAYLAWADATPAFIPDPRKYRRPALPFSLRVVLAREYGTLLAVIAVFFLLDAVGESAAAGTFRVGALWAGLAAAGAAVWVLLYTLRKRTDLLEVEGR